MVMVRRINKKIGEEKYLDGNIYKGEFVNGKKNGKGHFLLANGTFYDGDFKEDKLEGYVFIFIKRVFSHGQKLKFTKETGGIIH